MSPSITFPHVIVIQRDFCFRCWEGEAKVGRSGYLSQAGCLFLPCLCIHLKLLQQKSSRIRFLECGGSGMFIPDPDFYPSRIPDLGSRIPDPKTATKERGGKKFGVITFYVATNFTKLKIILVLKC
jgi:hypothetical protein